MVCQEAWAHHRPRLGEAAPVPILFLQDAHRQDNTVLLHLAGGPLQAEAAEPDGVTAYVGEEAKARQVLEPKDGQRGEAEDVARLDPSVAPSAEANHGEHHEEAQQVHLVDAQAEDQDQEQRGKVDVGLKRHEFHPRGDDIRQEALLHTRARELGPLVPAPLDWLQARHLVGLRAALRSKAHRAAAVRLLVPLLLFVLLFQLRVLDVELDLLAKWLRVERFVLWRNVGFHFRNRQRSVAPSLLHLCCLKLLLLVVFCFLRLLFDRLLHDRKLFPSLCLLPLDPHNGDDRQSTEDGNHSQECHLHGRLLERPDHAQLLQGDGPVVIFRPGDQSACGHHPEDKHQRSGEAQQEIAAVQLPRSVGAPGVVEQQRRSCAKEQQQGVDVGGRDQGGCKGQDQDEYANQLVSPLPQLVHNRVLEPQNGPQAKAPGPGGGKSERADGATRVHAVLCIRTRPLRELV
mmetsp:Transcript_67276/g.160453  ORF Transcript_67276/g.160453 Transcript_67276/m.160453 type:complete len:459 (+) Transcript_67276:1259-2635(+)